MQESLTTNKYLIDIYVATLNKIEKFALIEK